MYIALPTQSSWPPSSSIHSFIYGPKAVRGNAKAGRIANLLAFSEIPPALPALISLV